MVLRLALGAICTATAIAQPASTGEMPAVLGAYGLVHGAAATVSAVLLIVGELVRGAWFLARLLHLLGKVTPPDLGHINAFIEPGVVQVSRRGVGNLGRLGWCARRGRSPRRGECRVEVR